MTLNRTLAETDVEIGAQDPLHEAADLPRSAYTPVEHISHVSGLAVSTFYLIVALYMLLADATIRAYDSVMRIEKSGSAFNSPLPMMMKSLMVTGGFLYLPQLVMNLRRHLVSQLARWLVAAVGAYLVVYFVAGFLAHVFDVPIAAVFADVVSEIGKAMDPSKALQLRKMDLGTISLIMVLLRVALIAVMPFIALQILGLVPVMILPQIALFLPEQPN